MKFKYFFLLLISYSLTAQIINFPDANFKTWLVNANLQNGRIKGFSGNFIILDANNDGEIEINEAILAKELYASGVGNNLLTDFTGIEHFINLEKLICSHSRLSGLNISSLTQLKELNCNHTFLTTLNLSNLSNLEILDYGLNPSLTNITINPSNNIHSLNCSQNNLNSLNLSIYPNLKKLACFSNNLTSLDLSLFLGLEILYCTNNQLTSLNIVGLNNLKILHINNNIMLPAINFSLFPNLEDIDCSFNSLQTSVNVNGLNNLIYLNCYNNNLINLDLSTNVNLIELNCSNNQLVNLDLNNSSFVDYLNCNNNLLQTLLINSFYRFTPNSYYEEVDFSNNPSLNYICANNTTLNYFQNKINLYGYTNCQVNSYCTFTPGGTFYTIQGNNKFDSNINGCDLLDVVFPNLKFNMTDGTNIGSLISNATGDYSIPVQAGTYTITPVFDNPSYFNISPTVANVNFPTQPSPLTQNFCITPNGIQRDLKVILLPLEIARPGFDATYKIIYKNKGNTTQSGTVNLAFNDAVLDLVSATPVTTNQSLNNLSWAFTNLQPFEIREITLH